MPVDPMAIHGCGGVGLSAVHVADALGANVIAVDIIDEKLDKARSSARTRRRTLRRSKTSPGSKALHRGQPRRGHLRGRARRSRNVRNSVNSLRKGGQHIQFGLTTQNEEGSVSLSVDMMVVNEVDFHGSYGMPPNEYNEIFRIMDAGR